MGNNCELCGADYADEHYLDMKPLTNAQRSFGSLYVCEKCICEGLILRRKELAKSGKLVLKGQIKLDD